MGLGVEKRILLLSDWITDRAKENGILLPATSAHWDSTSRRWLVQLFDNAGLGTLEHTDYGSLIGAMRKLWTIVQVRWPR